MVIEEEELSVSDNAFAKAFSLYPNPVKNNLTVASQVEQYDLVVHSIIGQKIEELYDQSLDSQIDLSELTTGIYFVTLTTATSSNTFKIIKQ